MMLDLIREIGELEISLIVIFVIAYIFYLLRLFAVVKGVKKMAIPLIGKFFLRSAAFALLILALLGPYKKEHKGKAEAKIESKDIFIALDLSLSMDATDVPPSRIGRVKHELNKLISHFRGENIGLIIFSSQAYLQSPLTFDGNYLKMVLDGVKTGLVPSKGTDFFYPLQMALEKHKENSEVSSSAKVILLISDGEDFGDEAESIVDEIKKENIKLFALGVGTSKGSKIPYRSGFKKDKDGKDVVSKLNASDLKKLARLTSGNYYELGTSINQIPQLIDDLEDIKGEVRKSKTVDKPLDLQYHSLLLIAMIIIVIDALVSFKVLKL